MTEPEINQVIHEHSTPSEEQIQKELETKLKALCDEYSIIDAGFFGTRNSSDTFLGWFLTAKSHKESMATVINAGRFWQCARGFFKKIMMAFEKMEEV